MRKWICRILAIALCMCAVTAVAEQKNSLSDFANRLKKNTEQTEVVEETPIEEDGMSFGPALRINDPFYEKVRSSAYLHETDYSKEANVMIELKNISGRTLYPDNAAIVAYNADGEIIDEETYCSFGPDMIENGDSLLVWDWFYDIPVAEISYFEVKIESETSSYLEYGKIGGQALVSDGIAYALVENTTDSDIYGISATIAIENNEGTLLDAVQISTSNTSGIFPGSVMVLRDNAKDYANDSALMEGNAVAHVLHVMD